MRRSLLNQAWLNLSAQMVASIGALVMSVIVSRSLGPSETGRYSFATYVMLTSVTVCTLGAPLAALRWTAGYQSEPGRLAEFAYTTRRLGLLLGAVAATGLLAAAGAGITLGDSRPALAVIAVGAAAGVFFAFASAVIAGLARYAALVKLNAAVSVVQIAAAVGVAAADGGFLAFVGVVVGGSLLQAAAGQIIARRAVGRASQGLGPQQRKEFRTDSLEISLISLLDAVVFQRAELFLLAAFAADSEVALYALASVLAVRLVGFLPSAVNGVLLQRFSSTTDLENQVFLAMRWVALAAMPMSAVVIATADPLCRLLFGDEFADMAPVLRVVAAFSAVTVLSVAASSAIYAERRQRTILPRIAACAVLNIALALLLIPPMGAVGAALAAGATQVVATLIGFRLVTRELGLQLPHGDLRLIGAVSAVIAALGLFLTTSLGEGIVALVVGAAATSLAAGLSLLFSPAVTPEERSVAWQMLRSRRLSPGPR